MTKSYSYLLLFLTVENVCSMTISIPHVIDNKTKTQKKKKNQSNWMKIRQQAVKSLASLISSMQFCMPDTIFRTNVTENKLSVTEPETLPLAGKGSMSQAALSSTKPPV